MKINYFEIQSSVIKSKLNKKEINQKNVALWQTVGLLTEDEFISLMTLIKSTYPDEVAEPVEE